MTFRKDSLLFYQSQIAYIVIATLCLVLIPVLGVKLSLLCAVPFVILILVNPKLHGEIITIDSVGISCQKFGKQLWVYDWESIAELKRGSRFLMPSIEVIKYSKQGEAEQCSLCNQYFQLGRKAKIAINRYYST